MRKATTRPHPIDLTELQRAVEVVADALGRGEAVDSDALPGLSGPTTLTARSLFKDWLGQTGYVKRQLEAILKTEETLALAGETRPVGRRKRG